MSLSPLNTTEDYNGYPTFSNSALFPFQLHLIQPFAMIPLTLSLLPYHHDTNTQAYDACNPNLQPCQMFLPNWESLAHSGLQIVGEQFLKVKWESKWFRDL